MKPLCSSPAEQKEKYQKLGQRLTAIKALLKRPLTLAEKILYSHLDVAHLGELAAPGATVTDVALHDIVRGKTTVKVRPDRVAMQDATAQMAMLQFMSAGKTRAQVPSSIHCDHLITARVGAEKDLLKAVDDNSEVYDFLATSASKYGIDFWKPGSGIIHQVVLETYALPAELMIGTDSHTPNAGGLGMVAIGVGGADAADVMAGLPWTVTWPKLVGIKLTGKLSGWTSPKDVILKVAGIMTVKGGTGKIVEYFGPGVSSLSCTGRATVTNMGAELGATTSIFPFDEKSLAYLVSSDRSELAAVCKEFQDLFMADKEVEAEPSKYFDEIIEIDLNTLEPHVVGPHTPDLARPISKLAAEVKEKKYHDDIRVGLIGSCTNSSYEDIGRAAHIAEQASKHGVKSKIPLMITPGSETVYETIKRDGMLQKLEAIGGTVLANACGPCIGQWDRSDIRKGEENTIVTSFNRNFRQRNDGNNETAAFISSPEVVIAYALSGSLSFNPLKDTLIASDGKEFMLEAPVAAELPPGGLAIRQTGFVAPVAEGTTVNVAVSPTSDRIALLEPFARWDGNDFTDFVVLLKALGKCTTDHISPAGPWLRYRGHLDKISDNMFIAAVNAFTEDPGKGLNQLTDSYDGFSNVARAYQAANQPWVVFGDENYGEGSSREHAAMSPRFLGGRAIIVKSFARIHETNLKKQGMLPLIFEDPTFYDKVQERDRVSILGLKDMAPGKPLKLVLKHADGTTDQTLVKHSYTVEELAWFRAGSALNTMKDH